jgi:hypothetical protein
MRVENSERSPDFQSQIWQIPGERNLLCPTMKDPKVRYLLQTAAVMAALMVALAAALLYLAPAA